MVHNRKTGRVGRGGEHNFRFWPFPEWPMQVYGILYLGPRYIPYACMDSLGLGAAFRWWR